MDSANKKNAFSYYWGIPKGAPHPFVCLLCFDGTKQSMGKRFAAFVKKEIA